MWSFLLADSITRRAPGAQFVSGCHGQDEVMPVPKRDS